jgi:hypothetical protein
VIPATGGTPPVEEILTRGVKLRQLPDPGDGGAIDVSHPGFCELSSLAAETRTLGDPSFKGQEIDLTQFKDQGDIVVTTASPVNQTGNNTITFQDIGDHIRMVGFWNATDGWEWRVLVDDFSNGGLSTV